jgi:tetratricopeptide (TPR) repeat protein
LDITLKTAPKTENLFQEINHLLFQKGAQIDEVTRSRLVKEARQLIDNGIDPAGGYALLAALAVFRRDVQQVRDNYQQAIKIASHNPYIFTNYCHSLVNLGYISEAFDIAVIASDQFPNNSEVISKSIGFFILAGRYQLAAGLIEKFHQLSPNQQIPEEEIVIFAKKFNLNEANIQKYLSIAMAVFHRLQNRAKIILKTECEIFSDAESEWINLSIWIASISVEDLVEMTFELCDALAEEHFPIETTSRFLVSYHLWESTLWTPKNS